MNVPLSKRGRCKIGGPDVLVPRKQQQNLLLASRANHKVANVAEVANHSVVRGFPGGDLWNRDLSGGSRRAENQRMRTRGRVLRLSSEG
jgi:hypothetical protein